MDWHLPGHGLDEDIDDDECCEHTHTCDQHQHQQVTVRAGGRSFFMDKDTLTQGSPYFRAMFSGRFKEYHTNEIYIQLISAGAMEFIISYLETDKIIRKYEQSIEDDMATAAKFFNAAHYFQIPHLPTKIETILVKKLSMETWYQYWQFAEEMNLKSFKHKCMCFALYKFGEIRNRIECIDSLKNLHWYLSHKYLNVQNELDVFECGCDWLKRYDNYENGLLAVLSCIDFRKLSGPDILKMLENDVVRSNEVVVEVLKRIVRQTENIYDRSLKYSDEIQQIVEDLTKDVSSRLKPETPCIAGKIDDESYLFTINSDTGALTKYLKLFGSNWWGYSVVAWDDFNIVIACGEIGKGRGVWNKDIIRYNIFTEKWKVMNEIPNKSRRHAGAVVNKDYLYLIAGVGPYRETLSSVIKYDLKNDKWLKLPDLPETCQMPVAAFHNNEMYVAGEHLYLFKESQSEWINLGKLKLRHTSTFILSNYIYFTTNWSSHITRFDRMHCCYVFAICENRVVTCSHNIAAACNSGDCLYIFTEDKGELEGNNPIVSVEMCVNDQSNNTFKTVSEWPCDDKNFISNRSGCFVFVDYNIKDESINKAGLKWLK